MRYPEAARLVRSNRRIGGSSSTTRTVSSLATGHDRLALHRNLRHDRHTDRQHRSRAVTPVASDDRTTQRFDKSPADRQAKPGTGTAAILCLHAIEFVEDALEIGRRYAEPFVDDLDFDEFAVLARTDIDPAAGG